jgi:hypothetical protein
MTKKRNRLTTSARPVEAMVELDAAEAVKVNGGAAASSGPNPPVFGLWLPGHHPVFGVVVNPKKHHHKKPPFFGVPVHP